MCICLCSSTQSFESSVPKSKMKAGEERDERFNYARWQIGAIEERVAHTFHAHTPMSVQMAIWLPSSVLVRAYSSSDICVIRTFATQERQLLYRTRDRIDVYQVSYRIHWHLASLVSGITTHSLPWPHRFFKQGSGKKPVNVQICHFSFARYLPSLVCGFDSSMELSSSDSSTSGLVIYSLKQANFKVKKLSNERNWVTLLAWTRVTRKRTNTKATVFLDILLLFSKESALKKGNVSKRQLQSYSFSDRPRHTLPQRLQQILLLLLLLEPSRSVPLVVGVKINTGLSFISIFLEKQPNDAPRSI